MILPQSLDVLEGTDAFNDQHRAALARADEFLRPVYRCTPAGHSTPNPDACHRCGSPNTWIERWIDDDVPPELRRDTTAIWDTAAPPEPR